jgi:hypothetical protein
MLEPLVSRLREALRASIGAPIDWTLFYVNTAEFPVRGTRELGSPPGWVRLKGNEGTRFPWPQSPIFFCKKNIGDGP